MWGFAPAPSAVTSPSAHSFPPVHSPYSSQVRLRVPLDDDAMAMAHFAPTNTNSATASPAFPLHASILHRRSRAEKDASSDEDHSDDELDFARGIDSSDDEDSGRRGRAGNSTQQKRVKLSNLLPLAFTATSLSPPFTPSSRNGSIPAMNSASIWAPVRHARSRSTGDGGLAHSNGHSSGSPPSLTLQSPPRSPVHPRSTATPDSSDSLLPPSSPSTPSSAAANGGKRVPLAIIPPSRLGRTRSSGSIFSPRSHTSYFLAPPSVTHSPRAVQPDCQHSPLETLFTRLTMEEARVRGWSPAAEDKASAQPVLGFRGRRGSGGGGGGGGGEHRRTFSMTLSPAAAQSIAGSGVDVSPLTSPLKLIAEEEDEAAIMRTAPARIASPGAKPWLVRVDSAEEMLDNTAADTASAPPTALTGDSMLHFFHQLRLDAGDWTTLALAWRWKCKQGGVIYRSEFIDGMRAMGCETLEQLQSEVKRLKEQLTDSAHRAEYKDFFAFVFHFVRRTHETSRRSIAMDTACQLLESLLRSRHDVHVTRLCRYMRELSGGAGGSRAGTARVTFDQWQSLLDWCEGMDVEYLRYEEDNSCWPVMLDDFVEWMRQHDAPAMARYEARRQERVAQRLALISPNAASSASSSHSSYPAFHHPHQSDSIVDRITRLRVEHSMEPPLPINTSPTSGPLAPSSLSAPRRSSLSVRVPRPSSIEAVSLDSDDMPPRASQQQRGAMAAGLDSGGLGGGLDASMLSRSLPSIGSFSDLQDEADRAQQGGRTFAWDRGEAMAD